MYDPFAYDVACLGGLFCELIGVRSVLGLRLQESMLIHE